MDTKTIYKKLDRIDDLPTLPAIAMEVNRMLLDLDTSVNQLSSCIEKDQAMVSKMLKLVNSAFFGLKSKISTISHAVVILGFNTIRNAVVSISIIDALGTNKSSGDFDIKQFWKHSVAVAVTSRHLAERTKIHAADDCFVGGLLHDMGKIVMVQYFNDLFQKVWLAVKKSGRSFYEAEKSEIPIDHAQIGGYLAKKWQLPGGLVDAIRRHHAAGPGAMDQSLLMIIHAADIIANTYMADSEANPNVSAIHPDVVKAMQSQLTCISDWYPEVALEIESACKFFLEGST